MKREVAAEIVDSLKQAGVDFVSTLTEANLHDLVMASRGAAVLPMSLPRRRCRNSKQDSCAP
jgi:hypothetical protein